MLLHSQRSYQASSPVVAIVLLTGIVFILAMLVLLMCLGFQMPHADPSVPDVFKIARITYILDSDRINYVGFVTVINTDKINYRNISQGKYAYQRRSGRL